MEYGIVSCIYECTMHIKIEYEFTSNKNRGLKMNKSGTSFQYFYVVKIWQTEREYFESKTCMKSYYLVYSQPRSTNFEVPSVVVVDQEIKQLKNKVIPMVKVCGGVMLLKKCFGRLKQL